MKTRVITYISIIGILLIFLAQSYVVYQNFKITRDFLTRETDAIIDEAFHLELNMRQNSLSKGIEVAPPPPSTPKNSVVYNVDKMNIDKDDLIGLINIGINDYVSKKKPINMEKLDSVAGVILKSRNIHSAYYVLLLNPKTGKILAQSKTDFMESHFLIKSKYLPTDFFKQKSLQLVLLNPLGSIFRRMGILFVSSFLFSLFCFYGLWFLFRTLSRQKKLMEVKNDFFGNTAHELKRPVAQLHLALEALSKQSINEVAAKRERYLAISKEATKDMSEKITMIMTLSMAEEGVFKLNYSKFDLLEEVQKLKEQFSVVAGKEVDIRIEKKEEDFNISADRDHLRQCMANLLDNAIKYSGNRVLISITLQRLKDSLQISVKDNGIGIDTDKQDKVFEKYTRLNTGNGSPSGFGIGLSYVKTIIEKHAGHIELKSEPGKGSEFKVFLPM